MSLYLEKAIFINRAPFEHLELDFKEKGIHVLSAINGKGKTTILTYVVEAFHEFAKKGFNNSYEDTKTKYYRVSSPNDDMHKQSYSLVLLRFKLDDSVIDYVDIRGDISVEQYDGLPLKPNDITFEAIKKQIDDNRVCKLVSKKFDKEVSKFVFSNNVLTYFPSYRYEQPGYLNNPYKVKLSFDLSPKYTGYLTNPIETVCALQDVANWLMDVVLDEKMNIDGTKARELDFQFSSLMRSILSTKLGNDIRIGLGPRNWGMTRIGIIDNDQNTVYPSIFNMSSGESTLFSIFGTILMQADRINKDSNVTGIVLIDEIDKHLHLKLQKEILPTLFNLFPNIQFIVSSHSPFLNMGLADSAKERMQIIDLDNNGIVCELANNEQFKELCRLVISENQIFSNRYLELKSKMDTINKPVVITEGKTDWKHFKAALDHFKGLGECVDIDVEILEYDFDFGDSKLQALLDKYKLFPQRHKVIGIFDCDEANGKKTHKEGGIIGYGNNVWGMSIPIPEFRNYNTEGISIEFLYKDEDLKRKDDNGRRLYVTSEFDEIGRLKTNKQIGVKNFDKIKQYLKPEKEKIKAEDVVDLEGNSLALSKELFATNILERKENYSDVDFDAFRAVFDRLKDILNINYVTL